MLCMNLYLLYVDYSRKNLSQIHYESYLSGSRLDFEIKYRVFTPKLTFNLIS